MLYDLRRYLAYFFCGLGLALLFELPANAEIVTTDQVATPAGLQQEREQLNGLLDRPEVAKQLEGMGIAPADARARVDAMTDEEVHMIAGKLGVLPAGGELTTFQWIVIIALVAIFLAIVL